MQTTSKRWRINNIDWKKVGIGLLIGLAGAAATYLQETIPTLDFGQYQYIAVGVNSTIVNLLYKFIKNN